MAQETARDLVRAREDARGDLMPARHRLSKLLLRHGIVYHCVRARTGQHDAWLPRQSFDTLVRTEASHRAELPDDADAGAESHESRWD